MIFTVIFGSIVVFFLYCWVYANFFTIENTFFGMDEILLSSPSFWFAILLSVILTMLPHYAYKFARQYIKPNDIIIVREQLYREKHPSKKERRARKLKAMALTEQDLNGTSSSFQDAGITSTPSHVLGDDDLEDDDLDQVPVIRNSPTILSPEDSSKPGDIRQRQPSPSPMASLNRMDEAYQAYHLKGSSEASTSSATSLGQQLQQSAPPRELVGRRRVVSNNNSANVAGSGDDVDLYGGIQIATPARAFDNRYSESSTSLPMNAGSSSSYLQPGSSDPTMLEPVALKFGQGYPTTSFSFNQDFVDAVAAAGSTSAVGTPERPRIKRQSTPSVPIGGANFRFMGDDSPPLPDGTSSLSGTSGGQKLGHTGFAFSTDDASAFVYSHLNRIHSASHDERTSMAAANRARNRASQMSQTRVGNVGSGGAAGSSRNVAGRNSIDGSEFGSSSPSGPGFDLLSGLGYPDNGGSPPPEYLSSVPSSSGSPPSTCDTTAVDYSTISSRRDSLTRRPRGLSRSITAPDMPVAELSAMLLQQQKDMEMSMERLSKAQASVLAAQQQQQQQQQQQRVRFQGTSTSGAIDTNPVVVPSETQEHIPTTPQPPIPANPPSSSLPPARRDPSSTSTVTSTKQDEDIE